MFLVLNSRLQTHIYHCKKCTWVCKACDRENGYGRENGVWPWKGVCRDREANGHRLCDQTGPQGPRTAIIWFPKATDGTSPLKSLAAPEPIFPPMATVASQAQDSNYIWFPKATDGTSPLKSLAAPEPIFPPMATVASQAQDSQLYGFRKRRMAPRAWKASPRLSRFSHQ